MVDHDGGYKTLFANKRMVEDLLRGFVDEPWIDELDFSTLKRCEGSYVAETHQPFEQDMVWRVRWRPFRDGTDPAVGPGLYVYLLLEFQSRIDKLMALRMLNYLSLLYLDLVKQGELTDSGKLPPVLPIVLYNGPRRWSAPREVGELIEEVPGGLTAYRPSLKYLLLDEGEQTEAGRELSGNLAAALFRLEHTRDAGEVGGIVGSLAEWLDPQKDRDLRQAFRTWVTKVLSETKFPVDASSLEELRDMLRERVLEWTREWRDEGRREGRQEGRLEGRLEGEQRVLVRQLELKFGALDATLRHRIEQADDDQLMTWSENLLSAARLEDVFH